MVDRDDFIYRLRIDPDCGTTRAAFADWCEEQGWMFWAERLKDSSYRIGVRGIDDKVCLVGPTDLPNRLIYVTNLEEIDGDSTIRFWMVMGHNPLDFYRFTRAVG